MAVNVNNENNLNDNSNKDWFWKKIGFWFVPAKAGTLGPEEWAKVRKMSRTGKTRRTRRLFALLWVPTLAFEIAVSLRVVRLDPWAGLISAAWLAALMGLSVRALRIGFAQVSLEDLLGPFEATRGALAVTAVVVTWLAALVLAAPTMIRMWTQPDDPGETAAVAE